MMKIALLDLNHFTRGIHNKTVPLGLGMISRYLQKTIDSQLDIKMFKDADKALKAFSSWRPDILGMAQYSWNSQLNLYVAGIVKKNNPGCLVVSGGPDLDLETPLRKKYFQQYPFVDLCVAFDGEIPFAEIVRRMLYGEKIKDLRALPASGAYAYDRARGRIIACAAQPQRLSSLDVLGPLYADGLFDAFLEENFHPFIQTHRGCPFTCAFCHTGDRYYSRMLFLSPEIFKQDMQYLGRRFRGRHSVVLHLANTNMGLFKEDFPIAEVIRATREQYDWPRFMDVNSGKDPGKLLEMLSIIKFQPQIALQTLTPRVLKNIRRNNIDFKDFVSFQHSVLKKTNETSATELILCLPGETKESFLKTLKAVLNSGVQDVGIYSLMYLKGTLLSSEEYRRRFGYQIRHRVVPRQFSVVRGKKILDTEEVIVGTKAMPFKDYVELRGICFTVAVFFGSTELIPLKRLLIEYGVDIARWVFGLHKRLAEFPGLYRLYQEFIRETKDELFFSREALLKFYRQPQNFRKLCLGSAGDNLLRKYKCLVLSSHYTAALELTLSEAKKLLSRRLGVERAGGLIKNLREYLMTRDVGRLFDAGLAKRRARKIQLNYDIPRWLSASRNEKNLEDFSGAYTYSVFFEQGIRRKAGEFVKMNQEPQLSLQILYRDGNIRDFWPKWSLEKKKNA